MRPPVARPALLARTLQTFEFKLYWNLKESNMEAKVGIVFSESLPKLHTSGIPKEEIPSGLAPRKTGTEQCDCADCEANDCGPNGP